MRTSNRWDTWQDRCNIKSTLFVISQEKQLELRKSEALESSALIRIYTIISTLVSSASVNVYVAVKSEGSFSV